MAFYEDKVFKTAYLAGELEFEEYRELIRK